MQHFEKTATDAEVTRVRTGRVFLGPFHLRKHGMNGQSHANNTGVGGKLHPHSTCMSTCSTVLEENAGLLKSTGH